MANPYWTLFYDDLKRKIRSPTPPYDFPSEHRRIAAAAERFWYTYYIRLGGTYPKETDMAKKFTNDMRFVNYRLTKEDKAKFDKQYKTDAAELLREFAIMVGTGHRVTINWDDENVCYIVSVMGKEEGHSNYNKCLTARSDDLFEAQALVAWKHTNLFNGGEWLVEDTKNNWG